MNEKILIVEDEFIVANDLRHMLSKADYEVCGIAASVSEAKKAIEKHRPNWVMLDIFLQEGSMGTDLAAFLTEKNIGFIYISANTNQSVLEKAKATRPYGFLAKPFRERDLLTMLDIAREKHKHHLQTTIQRETMLLKQLELLNNSKSYQTDKLRQLPGILQPLVPFDVIELRITTGRIADEAWYYFIRTGFNEYQTLSKTELLASMNNGRQDAQAFKRSAESVSGGCYNGPIFQQLLTTESRFRALSAHFRLSSCLSQPVFEGKTEAGDLTFFSRSADMYTLSHQLVTYKAQKQFFELFEGFSKDKTDVQPAKPTGLSADRSRSPSDQFSQIIGKSRSLLQVLDNINLVATAQVSVLITGESGTGKERVAKSIHQLSNRRNGPLVTVNCAALPFELIESELFGHEKGSFTGATDKRIGKFEQADGGTIFLDEVGELPLDAQVKLLRVLQEKEIEHVGGSKTIKVDVRVIAATNRKLEKEVAEGRFRLDLYYRLNVFPIELPPLRERKEDIPALALHFTQKYSAELAKEVTGIGKDAMKTLQDYRWPGNIRELEHLVQRSVIMAPGNQIEQIEIREIAPVITNGPTVFQLKTLDESEAEHILGVLKHCKGKVCGPGGAAEILGVPPSTLNSRIKKLGIKRDDYFVR